MRMMDNKKKCRGGPAPWPSEKFARSASAVQGIPSLDRSHLIRMLKEVKARLGHLGTQHSREKEQEGQRNVLDEFKEMQGGMCGGGRMMLVLIIAI